MTSPSTPPESRPAPCACRAIDAYDCFAIRYGIHSFEFWDDFMPGIEPTQRELVDASGGPCECGCHYDGDDDWLSDAPG